MIACASFIADFGILNLAETKRLRLCSTTKVHYYMLEKNWWLLNLFYGWLLKLNWWLAISIFLNSNENKSNKKQCWCDSNLFFWEVVSEGGSGVWITDMKFHKWCQYH